MTDMERASAMGRYLLVAAQSARAAERAHARRSFCVIAVSLLSK